MHGAKHFQDVQAFFKEYVHWGAPVFNGTEFYEQTLSWKFRVLLMEYLMSSQASAPHLSLTPPERTPSRVLGSGPWTKAKSWETDKTLQENLETVLLLRPFVLPEVGSVLTGNSHFPGAWGLSPSPHKLKTKRWFPLLSNPQNLAL